MLLLNWILLLHLSGFSALHLLLEKNPLNSLPNNYILSLALILIFRIFRYEGIVQLDGEKDAHVSSGQWEISLFIFFDIWNFSPDSLTSQTKVGPQNVEFLVPVSSGSWNLVPDLLYPETSPSPLNWAEFYLHLLHNNALIFIIAIILRINHSPIFV